MNQDLDPLKLGFLAAATAWVVGVARAPDTFNLLTGIITYTHEGGHMVMMPFGTFICQAGGTGWQLAIPAAFVFNFYRTGQPYGAALTLYWLGVSCWHSARYCADAIHQELPLLFSGMSAREEMELYGETAHDWINMLTTLHLLWAAKPIAALLGLAGHAAILAGLVWGLHEGGVPVKAIATDLRDRLLPKPKPKKRTPAPRGRGRGGV